MTFDIICILRYMLFMTFDVIFRFQKFILVYHSTTPFCKIVFSVIYIITLCQFFLGLPFLLLSYGIHLFWQLSFAVHNHISSVLSQYIILAVLRISGFSLCIFHWDKKRFLYKIQALLPYNKILNYLELLIIITIGLKDIVHF